jgi:uncharacterized protein
VDVNTASAVQPEAYPVVEKIPQDLDQPMHSLTQRPALLHTVNPSRYTDDRFGLPTEKDILAEPEKPGRDPRPEFKTARFYEAVREITGLKPDMALEGVLPKAPTSAHLSTLACSRTVSFTSPHWRTGS